MIDVTFAAVEETVRTLHGVAHYTPVLTSCQLDALSGARGFLKCENFQRVDAFTFRGTYHAIARLMSSQPSRMFATVSSGNHGQGLALACRLQGATAHVVMPKPFSAMKHRAVLGYLMGLRFTWSKIRSCADARLRELVDDYQAVVVHPINDPFVIAGQGTVMVEFIDQVGDLDIVCWGQSAVEACSPVSVSRHRHSDRARPSLPVSRLAPWTRWTRSSRTVSSPRPTRTRLPMAFERVLESLTLPILRRHVAGFFAVGEEEIVQAMQFAYERLKLVIEPSNAVALVPLLRQEPQLVGKRVGVVLTGGNVEWLRP
jgi:threonine dehydratase